MAKKDSLQYAAFKRAKRIGKKGLKFGSKASTAFLVGGSTPSKNMFKKGLSAGSKASTAFLIGGSSGTPSKSMNIFKSSNKVTGGVPSVRYVGSAPEKENLPKKLNKLSDAENKAMVAKAKQMNAQIKKDQEAKKASDFKTLMERWNYENDNANPKGGRSNYGSGWTVENVKKRNKARQQKTKMGQSPNV